MARLLKPETRKERAVPHLVWYDMEYDKFRVFAEWDSINKIAAGDEYMVLIGHL